MNQQSSLISKFTFTLIAATIAWGAHFAPSASAESAPSQPVLSTLSKRQMIEKVSPLVYETILQLEARRGKPFDDAELNRVSLDKEFEREYPKALSRFCGKPEYAKTLACEEPAKLPVAIK